MQLQQRKKRVIQSGFSAIELLLALAIIATIIYSTIAFINARTAETKARRIAQQAYDYAEATTRFITAHRAMIQDSLLPDRDNNPKIITLSSNALSEDGFINSNSYAKNILNQYPCVIIYAGESRTLRSFLYYRTDGQESMQLNQQQLASGLTHIGAAMGIYQGESILGSARNWSINGVDIINSLFVADGNVDFSQGLHPTWFQCEGEIMAQNSYVVNIGMMLELNNPLPYDNNIHEFTDDLHAVGEDISNNTMNRDLIMGPDHTRPDTAENKQINSSIIFQTNPNCEINFNKPWTLQDYNQNVDGTNPQNFNIPNNLGCRNRQLSLAESIVNNQAIIKVTGFKASNVDYNNYVGEIKASSFQPTTKVTVGISCTNEELGKMAQQATSTDSNDVNNLYVSQVQCMVTPLCRSNQPCYMPINTLSIKYKSYLAGSAQQFICPSGSAAIIPTDDFAPGAHRDITPWVPQPSNSPGPSGCNWYSWDNLDNVRTKFICTDEILPGFCRSFYTINSFHSWGQGPIGENCSGYGASNGGWINITCTNDVSLIPTKIILQSGN